MLVMHGDALGNAVAPGHQQSEATLFYLRMPAVCSKEVLFLAGGCHIVLHLDKCTRGQLHAPRAMSHVGAD